MEAQETIIYRLIKINPSYHAYFQILNILVRIWRKNGYGLGPLNPTKKLAHWLDLLGQLLSLNCDLDIFRPDPPPPIIYGVDNHCLVWWVEDNLLCLITLGL